MFGIVFVSLNDVFAALDTLALLYDSMRTSVDQKHMNLHWKWSKVVLTESYYVKCMTTVMNSSIRSQQVWAEVIFIASLLLVHSSYGSTINHSVTSAILKNGVGEDLQRTKDLRNKRTIVKIIYSF